MENTEEKETDQADVITHLYTISFHVLTAHSHTVSCTAFNSVLIVFLTKSAAIFHLHLLHPNQHRHQAVILPYRLQDPALPPHLLPFLRP